MVRRVGRTAARNALDGADPGSARPYHRATMPGSENLRPSAPADAAAQPDAAAAEPLVDRVREVLALIRPAVQEDGGDVELVEVTGDGLVRVRLHGACVGCPSASMTLHHGIERTLRAEIREDLRVEAVP